MKNIREFKDIHSHLLPGDEDTVVNIGHDAEVPDKGYYSIGIHPWQTAGMNEESISDALAALKIKASADNVVAIGECGVDRLRGADEALQTRIFIEQIKISEELSKPLVIHAVRSYDIILRLKKEIKPHQLWIIHGFRGKAAPARQLTENGIALSYGEKFNKNSVTVTPEELLFTETDESCLPISEIRQNVLANRQ